jgi:hypothetical protein
MLLNGVALSPLGTCATAGDDEDGVTLVTPLIPGEQACVAVTAVNTTGGPANLWGWIDFNGNGAFDTGEALTSGSGGTGGNFSGGVATIANNYSGSNTFCFQVPANATFAGGDTHMRFRLTTDTLTTASWVGAASDGEVEDYYEQLACVGNLVWNDVNRNGIQDADEPAFDPAVTVHLVWAGPNGTIDTAAGATTAAGDDRIYSTTTNTTTGLYQFCGLRPGTYQLKVVTPPLAAPNAATPNITGSTIFNDSDGVQSAAGAPSVIPAFTIASVTSLQTGENAGGGLRDGTPLAGFPDDQENRTYDFGFSSAPTAIDLDWFEATANADGSVTVAWATAAEWDHAGFNVYRSSSESVVGMQVNPDLIAAQGVQGQGAEYELVDSTVSTGIWYYTLEDVDIHGNTTLHGPVTVTVGEPLAVGLRSHTTGTGYVALLLAGALALAFGSLFLVARRKQ